MEFWDRELYGPYVPGAARGLPVASVAKPGALGAANNQYDPSISNLLEDFVTFSFNPKRFLLSLPSKENSGLLWLKVLSVFLVVSLLPLVFPALGSSFALDASYMIQEMSQVERAEIAALVGSEDWFRPVLAILHILDQIRAFAAPFLVFSNLVLSAGSIVLFSRWAGASRAPTFLSVVLVLLVVFWVEILTLVPGVGGLVQIAIKPILLALALKWVFGFRFFRGLVVPQLLSLLGLIVVLWCVFFSLLGFRIYQLVGTL